MELHFLGKWHQVVSINFLTTSAAVVYRAGDETHMAIFTHKEYAELFSSGSLCLNQRI
jgi:hypothetical protein